MTPKMFIGELANGAIFASQAGGVWAICEVCAKGSKAVLIGYHVDKPGAVRDGALGLVAEWAHEAEVFLLTVGDLGCIKRKVPEAPKTEQAPLHKFPLVYQFDNVRTSSRSQPLRPLVTVRASNEEDARKELAEVVRKACGARVLSATLNPHRPRLTLEAADNLGRLVALQARPGELVLELYHGRNSLEKQPDGWGYSLPPLGGFTHFTATYLSHIRFGTVANEEGEHNDALAFDEDVLRLILLESRCQEIGMLDEVGLKAEVYGTACRVFWFGDFSIAAAR